jgi:CRP-like cAMP-binding protein
MNALTMLQLLQRFEQQHDLRLPGVAELAAHVQVVALKPRQHAFREGDLCPFVHVVRSGLLKQVYTRPDGSEWIKSFTAAGDLFACPQALDGQRRTSFASVAIEPSVVERIDFRLLEAAADDSVAWQKAIRVAFQRLAEIKVRRELDLLSLSAPQLYAGFAASHPQLLARLSQKDLAAFIGVTPVGLNRMLRRSGAEFDRKTRSAASRPQA